MDENKTENCCCCYENNARLRKTVRSDEQKRALNSRINRIIGQLNGVKNMLAEDRYCDDILIQLSAIDKSVKSLANVILEAHMHSCLIDNIQAGNTAVVDEIVELFKRFQ